MTQKVMAKIFISYRRQYDSYPVASISVELRKHFGEDSVFLDVDNIPLGVDFRKHLGDAVGQCDVLLAIISKQWLSKQGNKRLHESGDYVRTEIESALSRNIPVIPVLLDAVKMPLDTVLPESIKEFAYRNACFVNAGQDFLPHVQRLINGLETHFKSGKEPAPKATPKEETIQKPVETAEEKEEPQPNAEPPAASPVEPVEEISEKENVQEPVTVDKEQKPQPKEQKAPAAKALESEEGISEKKSEVLRIIVQALAKLDNSYVFLAGRIPDRKLKNVLHTWARGVTSKDILLLYDATIFGSAKEGLLLTADSIYWRNKVEGEGMTRFSNIKSVSYKLDKIYVNDSTIEISKGDAITAEVFTDLILNLSRSATYISAMEDSGTAGTHSFIISDGHLCGLSIPNDWSKRTDLSPIAQLQVVSSNEKFILIIIREPKFSFGKIATLKEYVDAVFNNVRKADENTRFFDSVSTIVGGFPAIQFEVSNTDSGLRIMRLFTCVETPKNHYQIVVRAVDSEYVKHQPELQQIINSFKEIN